MKVFVAGGTGFVGQHVISTLLDQGHSVRALVRSSTAKVPDSVETVIGDTTSFSSLTGAADGCDAIINLVGIIREFPARNITFKQLHTGTTAHLIDVARQSDIRRFIQMSANGTREDAQTTYHKTKWEAERLLRQSELDWTIFRPSLIYGPQDLFVNMLAKLIRTIPLIPVMGDGNYRLQPVAVADIATSFASALDRKACYGKTYHCCGLTVLTYNQLLDQIGFALGRKNAVRKLHQPLCLLSPIVNIMQKVPLFPLTADQLTMLLEENICDDASTWRNDFSLELTDFLTDIRTYLK